MVTANSVKLDKQYDKLLHLIILPTEQCNFRCKYCYEDFKIGNMSKEKQDAIILFLRKNIKNYTAISLDWFGGEPLLAMDAIEYISKHALEICRIAKKPLISSMTTNGYFLDCATFEKLSAFINNYKNGKEIRLYNQSEYILEQGFSQIMEKGVKINLKMTGMNVKYSSFREIFSIVMGTIIYIFVAIKSLLGLFSIGTIVQYIGSINRFVDGFISVVTAFTDLRNSCEPLKLYFDFMELPNKMQQGNFHVQKKDNKYEIEFKNVSFKYPGTENFVLENLNFKLRNGERMAVVGMNGSGKTTMIKLLCRLYDPTQGQITLNGIDIKNYNYNEYMSVFGIIFQDFKLFSFSLGQNIAASVDYDKTKAVNCLTTVGFYDRLKDMPKNLDTCLYKDFEDDGVEISGGEAQKIAMARALYKDAPILILDEPTAALDPIAEYKIYSKFNEIVEQKTTIYISHRLSSCRFCNDIAVFHEGKLLQRGSHNTLIADKNGKYFELWNAQAQYYNK